MKALSAPKAADGGDRLSSKPLTPGCEAANALLFFMFVLTFHVVPPKVLAMIEIDPKIIAAATSSLLEIFTDNAKDIGTAIWSWAKDERKRRDIFSGQAKEYSKALQQRYGTMKVLGMT